MSRRLMALLITVALVVAIAGVVLAQAAVREPAGGCEMAADRCTTTCAMLMNHYNRKFATMGAHEGDMQCWQTCWTRQGMGRTGTADEMKAGWMQFMGQSMRVNQCTQACWREHHENSNTVVVGGWRSEPRSVVCTP